MNIVIGEACYLKKNVCVDLPRKQLSQFDLKLDTRCTWEVGIDQSTSCTGIALMDTAGTYLVLMDIHRDKNIAKEIFYRELKYFLKRLFAEQKIKLLVHEKPVPSKYRSTGSVLLELKGKLEDWIGEIPELEDTERNSLYPQSWKSLVVDKSKGKNRFNDKKAIASDLVDTYPLLERYFNTYPYSDYDSFDALGILTGYKKYAYNCDGIKQICGTVEKRHTSLACYKQVPITSIQSKSVLQDTFGETLQCYKPKFLAYNLSHNLHDNIKMASSNNRAIFTILPKNVEQQLQWTFDIDSEDESLCTLMFVFRKGELTTNEYKVLQAIFPWNEVVSGEVG